VRPDVLVAIITKAGFFDGTGSGRTRAGPKLSPETDNRVALCERPKFRLAVVGRDDQTVPGDFDSSAHESFSLGVAGLVR
jgi:hypothetical protein